jgi:hypothetical protein
MGCVEKYIYNLSNLEPVLDQYGWRSVQLLLVYVSGIKFYENLFSGLGPGEETCLHVRLSPLACKEHLEYMFRRLPCCLCQPI